MLLKKIANKRNNDESKIDPIASSILGLGAISSASGLSHLKDYNKGKELSEKSNKINFRHRTYKQLEKELKESGLEANDSNIKKLLQKKYSKAKQTDPFKAAAYSIFAQNYDAYKNADPEKARGLQEAGKKLLQRANIKKKVAFGALASTIPLAVYRAIKPHKYSDESLQEKSKRPEVVASALTTLLGIPSMLLTRNDKAIWGITPILTAGTLNSFLLDNDRT